MKDWEKWKSFNVAGVQAEKRLDMIAKYVSFGSKLFLERDPENEYSKKAIKVNQRFKNGGSVCLGYVPDNERKPLAAELAPLMDSGVEIEIKFGRKFIKEETGECRGLQLKYKLPMN